MKTPVTLLSIFASLASALSQGTTHFTANLSGANEVPTNNSPFSGFADFTLHNPNLLTLEVTVFSPMPQPTGAFVHGPAQPGQNGSVVYDLGAPSVRPEGWFWNNDGGPIISGTPFTDLMAGRWYVSITSSDYPSGELRGQLVQAVPEPSGVSLMLLAASGALALRRIRMQRSLPSGRTMTLLTRITLTIAAIAVISCVTGCINVKSGKPIDATKVAQINKGVTTRAEVESLFGPPLSSQMMGDGRRMMIYSYTEVSGFTGTVFGGGGHGQSSTQTLQIILDRDNVVQDYELSSGVNQIR